MFGLNLLQLLKSYYNKNQIIAISNKMNNQMKSIMRNATKLILGLGLAVTLFSCNKDDNEKLITQDEAAINARLDLANDDISDVVEEQEASTYANSVTGRAEDPSYSVLSSCATISRVPAFGTPIEPGTTVTKTIDFGTVGCTLGNGNVLKGKIIITFVYQPGATSHTITYTFDNFYHNAIKFDGNKTFTRVMSVETPNSPSHPIVTMNMELTATFPNGNVYTRVGQRVREIISGYNTPATILDNVYKVTGSWTTTYPNDSNLISTITTPLNVKMSCITPQKPLLVSGIITFERNGNSATLDYGDGTCDNLAVYTVNGNAFNIIIGN